MFIIKKCKYMLKSVVTILQALPQPHAVLSSSKHCLKASVEGAFIVLADHSLFQGSIAAIKKECS